MLSYLAKFLSKKALFGILIVLPIACLASSTDSKYGVDARNINTAPNTYYNPVYNPAFDIQKVSYIPRVYISGYTGIELLGQGDIIAPVYLAENKVFAIYGQGRYTPVSKELWEYKTWTGSAGFLYRHIIPRIERVMGGYVLADHSQARDGHKYWVLGPGIESLGNNWDFRLNGYIPISKKSWNKEDWAQNFGEYGYIKFAGNNVYDHILSYYEEVGIGGDVEIGRKLFKFDNVLIKGYAQGYYHRAKFNTDVMGGGIKLTLQPNTYITFSANYIYDNYQSNLFMLGAQIRLNDLFTGSSKPNRSIELNRLSNRLFDLVDRSYGNIGSGVTVPMTTGRSHDLGLGLYSSQTVFIGIGGGDASTPIKDPDNSVVYRKGTHENPYTQDDVANLGMQTILNDVHSDFPDKVDIYLASGVYANNEGPVNFYQGMSVFGKVPSYTEAAKRNEEKPLLLGTIDLSGDNTLQSVTIKNYDGLFASGITVRNASNVVLKNVEVGTLTNAGNYATGITIENSDLKIDNSKIYGYQNGAATVDNQINATGIKIIEGGSLIISGSEVSGVASETGGLCDDCGNGYGVYADGKQEEITISTGSYILGQGEGGKDRSSNGDGVLIGGNHHNDGIEEDTSVCGNKLTISHSIVEGRGIGMNKRANANYSSIGSGLAIGYGYQHGDEDYENRADIISTIRDNEIIIDSSNLIGSGAITLAEGAKGGTFSSGLGYALRLGSGAVAISDIKYSGSKFNMDLSITNNKLSVINSVLTAEGKERFNRDAGSSGGSYALLVGNNSVFFEGQLQDIAKADLSIHDNVITVKNSVLNAKGDGVDASSTDGTSGYAYGMLVGYGDFFRNTQAEKLNINLSVAKNTVYFDHNQVNASIAGSKLVYTGRAWGIVIGDKNAKVDPLKPNKLHVSDSTITLNAYRYENYGIYLPHGELEIDDISVQQITKDSNSWVEQGNKILLHKEDYRKNVDW